MKKIIVLGAGGHAKSVLDALQAGHEYAAVGLTDPRLAPGLRILGVPVLGPDEALRQRFRRGVRRCVVAIGSVGDPSARIRAACFARTVGFSFVNVVHPQAVVSRWAELGEGIYVAPGAVVNAGAYVGHHAIINTNACVEHDCVIGDFVHVAPGVSLSGGVTVGRESHLGTGCSVVQGVVIGAGTVIGAGSVVTKDIPGGVTAFGNPCRPVRKTRPVPGASKRKIT